MVHEEYCGTFPFVKVIHLVKAKTYLAFNIVASDGALCPLYHFQPQSVELKTRILLFELAI